MTDKLAKLFEKNDKKKQQKAKAGLTTFTDPLSGETNFDMQSVKISLSTLQGQPECVDVVDDVSVDIGRAEVSTTEWSSDKSLFTDKTPEESAKPKIFAARGKKQSGVDSIKWKQLSSMTQSEDQSPPQRPAAVKIPPQEVKPPVAPPADGPKKFVARGKTGSTGVRPAEMPIRSSFVERPSKPITSPFFTRPAADETRTDTTKRFAARGQSGSSSPSIPLAGQSDRNMSYASQPVKPAPAMAATESDVQTKPSKYIPPSRR
ncbi:hypothetical protein XU18_1925 [Perkinsela sp. CCAP 1560/4]|nr:hypothetical protein XU18_1925 [Perkinsela sp. CCAP 1560/4]|eukprot:KNH07393.1 hypothetical protein XU18_1925 [Perkinsela sp. CCAP 1560/4]